MSRGDRSRPTGERTAEERERDRLERARRRGHSPQPPAADAPIPAQEHSGSEPFEQQLAPEPLEPDPVEQPAMPDPVTFPFAEPAPEQPAVETPPQEPVFADSLQSPVAEPAAEEPAAAHPVAEIPLERRSVEPLPRASSLAMPPPLPPELAGRPGRSPRASTRSWVARVGAVIALALVIAAVLLLLHSRSEHAKPIAAPVAVKVLIPEGKTRAQIAQITTAEHLSGSYITASRRSPLLSPTHYGAPSSTPDLEGFLFPATYDMNQGEPVSVLVEEQLTAFRENFTESETARAHALHITPYQLLTVASMVEREAQIPGDRAKIAAVIYNRLHQSIPLGIDASIYYAVEQQKGIATYTNELTEAELHIDSPYNTRTHTGLPPTPISNPGDASIHAAAYPAHVSYLYYVAGADGCGEQVFSNTLAEFEANDAAYQAAVKDNGGHPPSCKRKH